MIGDFNSWCIPMAMEVCDHIDLMITDNFSSTFTLGMSMCKSTCSMIVAEKSGFIAAKLIRYPGQEPTHVLWFT